MNKSLADTVPVIEARQKGTNLYYRIALDDLEPALVFFKDEGARVCMISGMDARDHLEVFYHFAIWGTIHTLIVSLLYDKPDIPTITGYFDAALLYERELIGLLGINVVGIPDSRPLELPPKYTDPLPPLRRA